MSNFNNRLIRTIRISGVDYELKANGFIATAAEWADNASYIPALGEVVYYAADSEFGYVREKIGDGTSTVAALPFTINFGSELITIADIDEICDGTIVSASEVML